MSVKSLIILTTILIIIIFPALSISISAEIKNISVAELKNTQNAIHPDPQWLHAAKPTLNSQLGLKESDNKDNSIRWLLQTHLKKPRGVALVIHGLNLKPAKMEAIIRGLNESWIDVLNVSLYGHGKNYTCRENVDSVSARMESFKNASYDLWLAEAYQAYAAAQKRSRQIDVPLFLVGFSFGGLMGMDLLAAKPNVRFEKAVLFAPAINVHAVNYLVKIFAPFPNLVFPSLSDESYQANNGTPVAAYLAFFESLNHFKKNIGPKLNIPTLVFIDKQDELVSYEGIKEMVRKENLSQWKILPVKKQKTSGPAKRHHLIIDADTTGTATWQKMMALMVEHLIH